MSHLMPRKGVPCVLPDGHKGSHRARSRRAYRADWRATHREQAQAYDKAYYEAHRKRGLPCDGTCGVAHRKQGLASDEERREKKRASNRTYYEAHREREKERKRQWDLANPGRVFRNSQKKIARRRQRQLAALSAQVNVIIEEHTA